MRNDRVAGPELDWSQHAGPFQGRKSSRVWGKQPMSLDSVRAFLQVNAPDIELIETGDSSATVELAAKVHGVEPAQIAKTICLRVGDKTLLIVASGIARLDNRKVKDVLGGNGRMLDPEQVLAVTGHSVGGVCPFGLLSPLPVYCDISLRRFKEVVPAAGSGNAALKIATERLVELTSAIWVDVCR
jgi:prolyl-tRNA editing enzyme YbaK/EbsC (Cys-tRNA(Pro) deacylase)